MARPRLQLGHRRERQGPAAGLVDEGFVAKHINFAANGLEQALDKGNVLKTLWIRRFVDGVNEMLKNIRTYIEHSDSKSKYKAS